MLFMTQVYAQNRTVTGTVTSKEDGLPLPGVTVKVKGTTLGTVTNASGKFTISVPPSGTLAFSFVGYLTVDNQPIPPSGTMDIKLEVSAHELNEVTINTAFGVAKSSSTLGYDATAISNKDLTQAGATNFTNGLTAKVAGLVITTGDNGINPATRFVLRGNRHINGNNFALVVLNGVPISPNDVNTINPDDIESIDVLNGASAAALYGSEASNGVLTITTKKGSTTGAPSIAYTNTYQFEKMSYLPPWQTQFGSYGGENFAPYIDPITGFVVKPVAYENQSYGPLYDGSQQQLGIKLQDGTPQIYPYSTPHADPRKSFFQTGHSETNNVSYASGDATSGFNLTVNRLDKTGTLPMDSYVRNIVTIGATHTYGMFKADFHASYTNSYTSTGGGVYSTLLNTPSWVPIESYKDITAPFADRSTYFNSYDVNPYSEINDQRTNSRVDAFNGNFTGVLTPAKWVDITYRLAANFGVLQQKSTVAEIDYSPYALSDPTGPSGGEGGTRASSAGTTLVPGTVNNSITFGDGSGFPGAGPQGFSRLTQDFIADFHKTFFTDFKANLRTGTTIWQEYANQVSNSAGALFIKNFYNVNYSTGIPGVGQQEAKIRQLSYFGDLSVGYKDWANIEGTLRNEHDSRLNDANRSIWFPSVNASIVLTNAINSLKNDKVLSYLKVRGSYAQVGDVNVSPYTYQPNSYQLGSGFPYGGLAGLSLSSTLNNPTLKPELTQEIEFGFDFGLFDGRITGKATYYKDNTTNQTININTSPASGYTGTLVNAGEMQNSGFEFSLDGQVLTKSKNKVGLELSGNFAIFNSNVISLINGVNSLSVGNNQQALVGYPYPELVASDVLRDPQGHVVVSATTGYPSAAAAPVNLGRTTPKYTLGLTQIVSYKFMSLTMTSEFRTGNVFVNSAETSGVQAGSSGFSASAGRSRFVYPNSVINTGTAANPVYTPNTNVAIQDGNLGFWDSGSFYTATSTYTESAAFWKLREADLAFDLTSFVKKSKAIKRASLTINGRNLLMFVPASNRTKTDPEFGGTGNSGGVQTTAQLPPSRFYGATLNVTF